MGVSDQNRPLLYIKFIWPHHQKFRILSVSTQKSVCLTRIPAVSEDGGWGLYLLLRTLVQSKLSMWAAACQDAVCCQSCWGGRFPGFGGFPLAAPWNPLGGLPSDKWLSPFPPWGMLASEAWGTAWASEFSGDSGVPLGLGLPHWMEWWTARNCFNHGGAWEEWRIRLGLF